MMSEKTGVVFEEIRQDITGMPSVGCSKYYVKINYNLQYEEPFPPQQGGTLNFLIPYFLSLTI